MKALAEIERIWPRDGAIRLVGRLHRADPQGTETLLLVQRDGEARRAYPVPMTGAAFDVRIPVEELVPPQPPEEWTWDLYLETGGQRIRVGRHLDDIRDKSGIMVFPEQRFVKDGATIGVRPRYTVKENLSIDGWRRA